MDIATLRAQHPDHWHMATAIRALAVGLEPDQSPEAQQAMVDQLEDLTMVGLLVAIKHFVVVNAGFFAAQGLRLPQGGLWGAPMLAPMTDADRARAGSARGRLCLRSRPAT